MPPCVGMTRVYAHSTRNTEFLPVGQPATLPDSTMTPPSPESTLTLGAAELGVVLTVPLLEQFARFCALLQEWNQRVNLTAITDTSDIYVKHFLDSLTALPYIPDQAKTLLDIGSGGGFPGLPLAIARPGLRVTLLEAHARKTAFLSAMVTDLGLPNVSVVTGRAETEGHLPQFRGAFDVTITRAVDALAVLVEYQLPFLRVGGLAIALKKGDMAQEVATATHALTLLDGWLRSVEPVTLDALGDDRSVILVEKAGPTPERYPRRPGMPAKRPL